MLTCGERLPWSPCYAWLEDGVSSRGQVGNGKDSTHSRTEEGECGDECDHHSETLACLGAEEEAWCECDIDRSYCTLLFAEETRLCRRKRSAKRARVEVGRSENQQIGMFPPEPSIAHVMVNNTCEVITFVDAVGM